MSDVIASAPSPASARLQPSPHADGAAAWETLAGAAGDPAAFCSAWLAVQCAAIQGAVAGRLYLRPEWRAETTTWPDGRVAADLVRLAERALAERRTVVAWGRREPTAGSRLPVALYVAQPLGPGELPYGVVAVEVALPRGIGDADPEGIARQLRVGAGWLEKLGTRAQAEQASATAARASAALDLLALAGEHRRLRPAALAVVNELASRLRCERVSLGIVSRDTVRVQAISGSATVNRRSRIVAAVEDAMDEAVSQSASVAVPATDSTRVRITPAHRALAALPGGQRTVATVLLNGPDGGTLGAVTLERDGAQPFDEATLGLAEAIGGLLGPIVALQGRAARWITGRAVDAAADTLHALVGPRHAALKLGVAAAVALAIGLAVATDTHRVGAKSVLEGEVQRAAVAPFDGFVRAAPARAGDTVRAGDLLAALDDRDLVLERARAWADREKLVQKQSEALAKHDRPMVQVLTAQIAQAQAQLDLAVEKLARARITAPFDGLVVSGDLSQTLGSPVEKGKLLFEVAPLDAYRLVVQVDERDIRWVREGQAGTLALASIPSERLGFTVRKITPVATAEDGRNFFRVEASIDEPQRWALRPGMEGVAKVAVGEERLLWIWGHALADWVRLAAWKWLP